MKPVSPPEPLTAEERAVFDAALTLAGPAAVRLLLAHLATLDRERETPPEPPSAGVARWAVFEDEDGMFRIVAEPDGRDVTWPEMSEADVERAVAEHNLVVNAFRISVAADLLGADALVELQRLRETPPEPDLEGLRAAGWIVHKDDGECYESDRLRATTPHRYVSSRGPRPGGPCVICNRPEKSALHPVSGPEPEGEK